MTVNWCDLVLAWLYDPPDTVLNLSGVRARAAHYASIALGTPIAETDLVSVRARYVPLEESLPGSSPAMTALQAETATPDACQVNFLTAPGQQARYIVHPLAGTPWQLPLELLQDSAIQQIDAIIADLTHQCPDTQSRFLALWRFLPERLATISPALALLPADARVPDHAIWNHADLQAALLAATSAGDGGALLSFTLGPVQEFVKQARSLRDLWAGSYILSWLTFQSMQPVLSACGPTAFIFPHLRGNPLYDLELQRQYPYAPFSNLQHLTSPASASPDRLLTGSLPNTFLALVPMAAGESLAQAVQYACQQAWLEMCEAVRKRLEECWGTHSQWTLDWQQQVEHFWDIHTVSLPLQPPGYSNLAEYFRSYLGEDRWPPVPAVSTLKQLLLPTEKHCSSAPPGLWTLHTEMAQRVLASSKHIRHIPPHARATDDRAKCTLMAAFEQMGPGGSAQAQRAFWEYTVQHPVDGTHVRRNERLCAIALVKRFCWVAYFAGHFGRDPGALRFSDTATIAAHDWLQSAEIDPLVIRRTYNEWYGQWVFQEPSQWDAAVQNTEDADDDPFPGHDEVKQQLRRAFRRAETARQEPPRPYYAAFVMDGDHMGQWLNGTLAPRLEEIYHPTIVAAFHQFLAPHAEVVQGALTSRRPLSPVLHAAISAALGNFARHFVPDIVKAHHGELVYAGGDDVLALLPTRYALACVDALRQAYSGTGATFREQQIPQGWAMQDERLLLLMGPKATVSAGLVIAHYKADLREVLDAARAAETAVKQAGRAALGIALLRRSGERTQAICPWAFAETLQKFAKAFVRGASDRWAYYLHGEVDTLRFLDDMAIAAVITRVVNQGDITSRRTLVSSLTGDHALHPDEAGAVVADCYRHLCCLLRQRASQSNGTLETAQRDAFGEFIALVQAASFLARGRERES
jgi:CRISPR-associated protein Cmr2